MRLFKYISILFGAMFLYGIYRILSSVQTTLALSSIIAALLSWKFLSFLILFALSHFLRTIRLYQIRNNYGSSVFNLFLAQLHGALYSLSIPFKLGEVYRWRLLGNIWKDHKLALTILIGERLLDFFVLGLLFVMGILISNLTFTDLADLSYVSFALLLTITILVLIIEPILEISYIRLLKNGLVRLASFVGHSMEQLQQIKLAFGKKATSISGLSIVIWLIEVLSILIVFNQIASIDLVVLIAVGFALAGLIPNGPAGIGGFQLVIYILMRNSAYYQKGLELSFVYSFFLIGAAILVYVFLFLISRLWIR